MQAYQVAVSSHAGRITSARSVAAFFASIRKTTCDMSSASAPSFTGRRAAVAPPSETPEGEAAPLAFGAHVPFGPMLAIAGALYFLAFRGPTLRWLADIAELF